MPKKPSSEKPHKSSKFTKLPSLTGVQQQVMAYVMNGIASGKYDASADKMAGHFNSSPKRFTPTLRKLVDKGYLTIRGETMASAYPTVSAIRGQDKQFSDADARKILARIKA